MSPVERLQAALEKLEALKAESTQGEWGVESLPETGESRIHSEVDGFAFMGATSVTFYPVPGGLKPTDAELIVTMHQSIDAQLSILRFAVDGLYDLPEFIALADAILGERTPAPELTGPERLEVARFGIHPELTIAEDF